MTDFEIEINTWSCLGGYNEELFEISKKGNEYLLKSKRTKKSHLISKLKIDSLKNYLKTRIGKVEGGCTSGEYIRLGTRSYSVDYEHSYCWGKEAEMINNLLNYRELADKPKE